jgi:hypothetical protein
MVNTMTNPTPNRPPLWQVMLEAIDDALEKNEEPVHERLMCAAELRAIAEEMVLHFDPWLQEHADVEAWLLAEAERAEAGK